MRTIGLPIALLAFALSANAQASDSAWQHLQQLQPGDRVEIVLKSNAKHSGTFVMLADDAITLRAAKGETGYRRDEVTRVSRMGSARRGRAALIGLASGAGVGAVAGVAGGGPSNDPNCSVLCGSSRGLGAAVGGVAFGAVGAAVGAVVARPAKTEVYRAP